MRGGGAIAGAGATPSLASGAAFAPRCTLFRSSIRIKATRTRHRRFGQIEAGHAPASLTDRGCDGLVRDRRLPIGARQITGVHELALRAVTTTEWAMTASAILLPGYDRHIVEAMVDSAEPASVI